MNLNKVSIYRYHYPSKADLINWLKRFVLIIKWRGVTRVCSVYTQNCHLTHCHRKANRMKILIAFAFLVVAVIAERPNSMELYHKYTSYLHCASKHTDALTKELNCEKAWNEYRRNYLSAIEFLEYCNYLDEKEVLG